MRKLLLLAVLIALSACSAISTTFSRPDYYPVKLSVPEGFRASVFAREDDGNLLVKGRITRRDHKRQSIKGYVEIKVLNRDGTTVDSTKVDFKFKPTRKTHRKMHYESTFLARLASLPRGGRIILTHINLPTKNGV